MPSTVVAPSPPTTVDPTSGDIAAVDRVAPSRPRSRVHKPRRQAVVREESAVERVCRMSRAQILEAIEHRCISRRELMIWATRFPEEVPLINGELPWIVYNLADYE